MNTMSVEGHFTAQQNRILIRVLASHIHATCVIKHFEICGNAWHV